MLQKANRIAKKEFSYILARGKRYNSPHLLLYIADFQENKAKASRFSFSVSKKVAKTAVERNKHRRRGYSVVSKYIQSVKPGFFLFFSFKKGISSLKFESLEKEVSELLSSSGVLS